MKNAEATTAPSSAKWYHVNRNFVPIKLLYFWWFAGAMAVLPLLTLHMTHIGLSFEEIAQVYVFLPVASFMGPPIIGYIADRTGWIRELYVFCVLSSCLSFNTLFFLVPISGQTSVVSPVDALARAPLELPCRHWPQVLCSNITSDQDCRIVCDDVEAIADLTHICPAGVCRSPLDTDLVEVAVPQAAVPPLNGSQLRLSPDADGCLKPALATAGAVDQLPCPANCSYRCRADNKPAPSSRKTFWAYFANRLVNMFFLAPSFTLLDATNLALVKQHSTPGQNFGRQRVMAIVASIVTPPLVGLLVDIASESGPSDYEPAFHVNTVCTLGTVLTLYVCKLRIALPEKAHIREAGKILKQPEVLVFIVVVAVLGSMWGFLENFLFVFLRQLNAPNYLLGLTLTVAGLASIPFNWWSEVICDRVGNVNILIVAFFGYAIRYIGYSYMTNPWLCMPFELMEVVTTHLMWNSAATYAGHLAPPGLLATLIGLAGALHYSFGRGVGSFVGGYLMALKGAEYTFRAMGTASGVGGVLYAGAYYGFLRRHIWRRESRIRAKADAEATNGIGEGPQELAVMLEEHAISGV